MKLATLPNSFEEVNRVRCFNHTLQLSAKALLRPFNAGMGKMSDDDTSDLTGGAEEQTEDKDDGDDDNDDDNDDDEPNVVDLNDDPDDNIDELDVLTEGDRDKILEDTSAVRAIVSKLRNLAFAIVHSTTLALPAWRRICVAQGLKAKLMPRDVVTRWNSTFDMLQFSLSYRKVIDIITADKNLKLRKYELDNEDWKIAEDLSAVLEQYKLATLYFSKDSASISAVIPAMDRIDNKLNARTNQTLHPSIVAAMQLARRKLNRYYELTDLSAVYRVAMGM